MPEEFPTSGQGKLNLIFTSKEDTSLKSLHDLFIKHKFYAVGTAPATIENYKINFKLLFQFKPDITVKDLTEETMVDFLEFLNTRERKIGNKKIVRRYKNSSIATVRGKLSAFFTWLIERDYLKANPFEKIAYPDVSYTDSRAFSHKEFEKICHAVNTKIQWSSLIIKKRNIAIVMLLALTGVRKEELLGLELNSVDLDRKLITVRAETSKSKRTRIIPLNPQLTPYLEDYLNYRKDYASKHFWVSGMQDKKFTKHGAKHLVRVLIEATNINCHLHRFRHTFATNYYKQTNDLVGLQKILGHRSLKMTLSYLRSLPDEHIVEQIEKMTINEFV